MLLILGPLRFKIPPKFQYQILLKFPGQGWVPVWVPPLSEWVPLWVPLPHPFNSTRNSR